jgi:4-carboxymuconolactone decarboxylase
MAEIPGYYKFEQKKRGQFIDALEALGKTLKEQGPLDTKTAHPVQLAASIAIHSEGGVHSHARRVIESGATPEEIYQAEDVRASVDHAGMNGRDAVELDGWRWRSGVRLDSEQPGSLT